MKYGKEGDNMEKKLLAIVVAIVLTATVFSAGCTSNTGSPTPPAVASITPSAVRSTTPSVSSMITYDSRNFTIQYPSDWGNDSDENIAIHTFSAWPKTTNTTTALDVYFIVDFLPLPGTTLSEWTAAVLTNVQNYSNFTLISAGNATLAGYPAYKIVYTATGESLPYSKVTEIWTVKEGNISTVNYRAIPEYYDTYADTAQKMIDSFQIK